VARKSKRYACVLSLSAVGFVFSTPLFALSAEGYVNFAKEAPLIERDGQPNDSSTEERSPAEFSITDCQAKSDTPMGDVLLSDPNLRLRAHNGVILRLGETLCITGQPDENGLLENVSVAQAVAPYQRVIATRLSRTSQGTLLQISHNYESTLDYLANIPLNNSRLTFPSNTQPVNSNSINYETWPSPFEEVILTNFRLFKRRKFTTANQRKHIKGPQDRRWGMDLLFTTGLAQLNLNTLDSVLASEGFGHLNRVHTTLGLNVGGFWRPFRFGIFLRGAGKVLDHFDPDKHLDAYWFAAGPYLGLDLLRWRSLTTYVRLDYEAGEVRLNRRTQFPSFVNSIEDAKDLSRGTHSVGMSVGHDYDLPLYSDASGQGALLIGTSIGYARQFAQNKYWKFQKNDKDVNASPVLGPSLDTSGFRFEIHIGGTLYVF
jgi:hypothetical protein